ncbi:MAG: 1-deoxy-D-xylulose-5-phosphate synthase [Clostridiales bacterium]|nr:1-deoxy-D-xylulose-5-phosphate synthase [Clostridiales bacterium]
MQNDYRILETVKSPEDVKKLDDSSLEELCREIRKKIISTVSNNGGHLASNLGTVELTVALHKCFNCPDDTLVFDVGHQSYTHKLLTGRFDRFDSLRKKDGISGFTRPDESNFDSFYEGHAGVSVSQALGVAAANKIKGNDNYSIAVLGDGALGNGMIYEALNHAGSCRTNLIVILNDNEMSISENVGAMARYLAVIRSNPDYYRLKANTEKMLSRLPLGGKEISHLFFSMKTALKNIIYSSSFFEDLGFRYIGPIDGHNINTLTGALMSAKMHKGPVLLHVNTVKGYGYELAENHPEKFHGISEFDVETGEAKNVSDSFSSEFSKIVCKFAENDKRICAVTAAMSIGTGLEDFSIKFPDRFFDVGIAEEHAVTFASGLSAKGMVPVFAVYSTFLQRSIDQVIHDASLQRQKMIIMVDRAGFVGEDGETHQGLFDIPLLKSIPDITIYSPSDYNQLEAAFKNAVYFDKNLVVIRYPRGGTGEKPEPLDGKSDSINFFKKTGSKTVAVSYGRLFNTVRSVIEHAGLNIDALQLFKISPIEKELFDIIGSYDNVILFEEGMKIGGIGEEIGFELCSRGFKGNFKLFAVSNSFVSHASVSQQLKQFGLDEDSISRDLIGYN